MRTGGPKPEPTALRLVKGSVRADRPMNEQEPLPSGEAARPTFLKDRAAEIWDQYAPDLQAQGVLTSWDSHMFAVWCELVAEFERDRDRMNASRIAQMRALASSFGLDPSSRSRIVGNGGQQSDPAERYFA